MSTSTSTGETPAPVVYARKSQPILKPEPVVEEPIPADLMFEITWPSPSEMASFGSVVTAEEVPFVEELAPVASLPPPPPRLIRITMPPTGVADPIPQSLEMMEASEESDSKILNAALTGKLQNRKSSVSGRKKKAGVSVSSSATLTPSSQVESGLPLKKRGRPAKNSQTPAQADPANAQPQKQAGPANAQPQKQIGPGNAQPQKQIGPANAQPQKQIGPANAQPQKQAAPANAQPQKQAGPANAQPQKQAALANTQPQKQATEKPAINKEEVKIDLGSHPAAVPNGIKETESNIEQAKSEPSTPVQVSETNSASRSQRKRNPPKWCENMVMDIDVVKHVGAASRGSRTPVASSRKSLDSASTETPRTAHVLKSEATGNSSEVRKVSKPIKEAEQASENITNLTPRSRQRSKGRVRRRNTPPSKDIEPTSTPAPIQVKEAKIEIVKHVQESPKATSTTETEDEKMPVPASRVSSRIKFKGQTNSAATISPQIPSLPTSAVRNTSAQVSKKVETPTAKPTSVEKQQAEPAGKTSNEPGIATIMETVQPGISTPKTVEPVQPGISTPKIVEPGQPGISTPKIVEPGQPGISNAQAAKPLQKGFVGRHFSKDFKSMKVTKSPLPAADVVTGVNGPPVLKPQTTDEDCELKSSTIVALKASTDKRQALEDRKVVQEMDQTQSGAVTPNIEKKLIVETQHKEIIPPATEMRNNGKARSVTQTQNKEKVQSVLGMGKSAVIVKRNEINLQSSSKSPKINPNVNEELKSPLPKAPETARKESVTQTSNAVSIGSTNRKRKLEDTVLNPNSQDSVPQTVTNGAENLSEPAKRARQSIPIPKPVTPPKINLPSSPPKPPASEEMKKEVTKNTESVVEGPEGVTFNGFGTASGQSSFVGMPKLLNQSGLPIVDDSDDSSDDEDHMSASATTSNCSSSRSGPYIKDAVIRFLENKISNRNMLRIREELMTVKQSGNYFRLTKTAPMAAGLVHDMFCQSFSTQDPEDEMQ